MRNIKSELIDPVRPFIYGNPSEIIRRRDRRLKPYAEVVPHCICPFTKSITDAYEALSPIVEVSSLLIEIEGELNEKDW